MESLSITRTYFEIIFPWRSSRGELLNVVYAGPLPIHVLKGRWNEKHQTDFERSILHRCGGAHGPLNNLKPVQPLPLSLCQAAPVIFS